MKPAELNCLRLANVTVIRRVPIDTGAAFAADEPTQDAEFDAMRIGVRTVAACERAGWLRRVDHHEKVLFRITVAGIKQLIAERAAAAQLRKRVA